jgi:hypothetical protein
MSSNDLAYDRRGGGRSRLAGAGMFTVSALLAQLAGAGPASAFDSTDFRGAQIRGQAFGAQGRFNLFGGPNVSIGKVALQTLPCVPNATRFNNVLSLKVPGNTGAVLTTGVVENRGSSSATTTSAEARESSQIANVSALGGLIQADLLTARAHTTRTSAGVDNHLDDANVEDRSGAQFVNLVIGNTAVDANPGPNTVINLSVGGGTVKVILNEVKATTKGVKVNAIHVIVDDFLGIDADFVIAHAETSLTRAFGQLSGFAYLSQVKLRVGSPVDPLLKASSGRQNVIGLPCNGTNGAVRESVALGVDVPTVLESDTSRSTVQGDIDANGAFSESTHTVEDLNVLNGTITADLIRSKARTETTDAGSVVSTGDFELVNLKINGKPFVEADLGAKIDLPGIGYVRIGEKRCSDDQTDKDPCTGADYNAITVYAIHVVVDVENLAFTEVMIGAAHSDVRF